MILVLTRTYFPDGTNGKLECNGAFICYTIELPWKDNQVGVSCIPEGEYFIRKRYSAKFKWHLEVMDVPQRKYILFHPANYALKELHGCIAPVLTLSGSGVGLHSRRAFEKLKAAVYRALDNGERVQLIIHS
ncbi:DUF5675 family protein [Flavobacterium lacus]|uniref:DUF5675 domain-containing protein n=1 Tax=Flavobacterium lacus TaxID=1353778 RepID=A0A328WQ33_9FLAO|nr:DUF5675 family protein [Flavobacterium lacus]RAR46457.1 hypothetical protein B0I10_11916 [Flavobacterium lacus]